jgi:hypothetical protein
MSQIHLRAEEGDYAPLVLLPGDGVGREVMPAAQRILDIVRERHGVRFETQEFPCGGEHYVETGEEWPAEAFPACRERGIGTLVLAGGVAANARLRELARQRCVEEGIELRQPRLSLCTDNGAMIAALGAAVVDRGLPPSPLNFATDSSLPVTQVLVDAAS